MSKEQHYLNCINWLRGAICNLNQGYPEVAGASIDRAVEELKKARKEQCLIYS